MGCVHEKGRLHQEPRFIKPRVCSCQEKSNFGAGIPQKKQTIKRRSTVGGAVDQPSRKTVDPEDKYFYQHY